LKKEIEAFEQLLDVVENIIMHSDTSSHNKQLFAVARHAFSDCLYNFNLDLQKQKEVSDEK